MEINFLATSTGTRPELVAALLESFNALAVPPGWRLALLVLDQAPPLHEAIFARCGAAPDRTITRVKSGLLGLSAARNRLLTLVSGNGYVVFCDDDASYAVDFLLLLAQELAAFGHPDIGLFRLLNKGANSPYGNRRYPSASRLLGRHELINLAISLNLAMRVSCMTAVGGFNPALGVGSPGLCGEETELILRAIDHGARSVYCHGPLAYHPRQELGDTEPTKVYDYSLGYRNMLLGYRGSARLRLLVRLHLGAAIARCAIAFALRPHERSGRRIKLRGLLGLGSARGGRA